jgi:hypothetical protein
MTDDPDMEAFRHRPAAWADPALVAPLLAPGMDVATASRLLGTARLAERASAWLVRRLGDLPVAPLPTEALCDPDRWLALAPVATLSRIAVLSGAVWNAERVRRLVLADDIAGLAARHGEAARAVALRHVRLTPSSTVAGVSPDSIVRNSAFHSHVTRDSAVPDDIAHNDLLLDDIVHDGARALASWIAALPNWAAARMRLKWAGREPPWPGELGVHAVTITRAVAAGEQGA